MPPERRDGQLDRTQTRWIWLLRLGLPVFAAVVPLAGIAMRDELLSELRAAQTRLNESISRRATEIGVEWPLQPPEQPSTDDFNPRPSLWDVEVAMLEQKLANLDRTAGTLVPLIRDEESNKRAAEYRAQQRQALTERLDSAKKSADRIRSERQHRLDVWRRYEAESKRALPLMAEKAHSEQGLSPSRSSAEALVVASQWLAWCITGLWASLWLPMVYRWFVRPSLVASAKVGIAVSNAAKRTGESAARSGESVSQAVQRELNGILADAGSKNDAGEGNGTNS